MKNNRFLFLSLFFGLSATSASATVEDWYTYWGFGFADHTYEEPFDSDVRTWDSFPGVNRSQTAYDLLGFYWPLKNNHTSAGFVISGSADRLDNGFGYGQINQYLYAGSAMHFFGKEIGDGFFVRGDLGLSKRVVSTSITNPVGSDTGSGILLGVGYGIPVSEESRVLISLTASTNTIEGHEYHSTAIRIGGLW